MGRGRENHPKNRGENPIMGKGPKNPPENEGRKQRRSPRAQPGQARSPPGDPSPEPPRDEASAAPSGLNPPPQIRTRGGPALSASGPARRGPSRLGSVPARPRCPALPPERPRSLRAPPPPPVPPGPPGAAPTAQTAAPPSPHGGGGNRRSFGQSEQSPPHGSANRKREWRRPAHVDQ